MVRSHESTSYTLVMSEKILPAHVSHWSGKFPPSKVCPGQSFSCVNLSLHHLTADLIQRTFMRVREWPVHERYDDINEGISILPDHRTSHSTTPMQHRTLVWRPSEQPKAIVYFFLCPRRYSQVEITFGIERNEPTIIRFTVSVIPFCFIGVSEARR